jgi:hypothetical protein
VRQPNGDKPRVDNGFTVAYLEMRG